MMSMYNVTESKRVKSRVQFRCSQFCRQSSAVFLLSADIDVCASPTTNNCVHGTCVSSAGSGTYTCDCDSGYTGQFCDTGRFNDMCERALNANVSWWNT